MRVEQAIFGEVRSGHALRLASGEAELMGSLAARLDLPDTAPPGTEWSPYVSGFPYLDRYVVARTFRDPAASRSGMVLAHALVAPLEALVQREDLAVLFEALINEPSTPEALSTLKVEATGERGTAPACLAAAAGLLAQRGVGPVVLLGTTDLESLAVSLWSQLTPNLRRGFAFRLSFGPGDLTEVPAPVLVCTPSSLLARWQGYRVIDKALLPAMSLAADWLAGAVSAKGLEAFRMAVGAEPMALGELALLEQAYRLASLEAETFANLSAAMRLVERLSPDPSVGVDGKAKLLDRLVLHLDEAPAAELLILRNATLSAYSGVERLWSALERWIARANFPPEQDFDLISVIEAADAADGAHGAWRAAVGKGLETAAAKKGKAVAQAFWRWGEQRPAVLAPLWRLLSPQPELESALVAAMPAKLSSAAALAVADQAFEAGFHRLHGGVVGAAYPIEEAIDRQLAFEPISSDAGLRLTARAATPAALIAFAAAKRDIRLTQIAAELIAKMPKLLNGLDLSALGARELWSEALFIEPKAWRGLQRPEEAFQAVLDDVLDRQVAPARLVEMLSTSPLANLADYPRRSELWAGILEPARSRLLQATAVGWLQRIERGASAEALEPVLATAVAASPDFDIRVADLGRTDPARAVQLLALLPEFGETRFRAWLVKVVASGRAFNLVESEALGLLIDRRQWKNAAQDLLGAAGHSRQDLRPALSACISLFGYIDRLIHGIGPLSVSEKWESFEELASELYPRGPDDEGVWARAGGKDADLQVGGSGRGRWRAALLKVRYGGGVKTDRLFNAMLADFPTNASLKFLAKDPDLVG